MHVRVGSMHWYNNCPLHSCSCHHGCREPIFRLAKQGLSQISGRRILRVIGHFVSMFRHPSLHKIESAQISGARSLHRSLHPLLALFLFWLRQENQRLETDAIPYKVVGECRPVKIWRNAPCPWQRFRFSNVTVGAVQRRSPFAAPPSWMKHAPLN